MKSNALSTPEGRAKFGAADPLINIVDELQPAISILRTVWCAIENPEMQEAYSIKYYAEALEHATDLVAAVQDRANRKVHEIRGDF